MTKPFSEACERNRGPILAILKRVFAARRHVLEIGSGTGQHAAYFAPELPNLVWQASDVAESLPGIRQWVSDPPPPSASGARARSAGVRAPPFTCDSHIHVFGPYARYPLDAVRRYTPEEARLEDYLRVAKALGTERVVLVQPSVYGVDNSCQRDAIAVLGERARGVAVIDDSVSDVQLGELDGADFVGARLNFMRAGELASLERTAARVKALGWHVQLHLTGSMIAEIAERLLRLPTEFVIDHFGRVDPRHGVWQPAFQALHRLVDSGKCWVKLSAPYRIDTAPYRESGLLARELVKRNPERMVWGTDWPHPDVAVLPEDQVLLDVLAEWVPDEKVRHHILVENPARLYRF